jgi:hypothetical protein
MNWMSHDSIEIRTYGICTWYGVLLIQTSKYGNSGIFTTSPMSTSSRFCSGFPCTRLVTSAAIRGSSSTAMTFFAFSRIFTVKFPDPGPTSRTIWINVSPGHHFVDLEKVKTLTSLCLRSALSTIA